MLPGDRANKTWLGTPVNAEHVGNLAAIDKAIVDPTLRKIWLDWLHHPANFLSWIIYPVAHQESTDLMDLKAKFIDARHQTELLAWFDDGLCMFSWILKLVVPNCPPALAPIPDPKKWLRSINKGIAITSEALNPAYD